VTEHHSAKSLFVDAPLVEFRPAETICHKCDKPLTVLKTRTKTIYTLAVGRIKAKEYILECKRHNKVYYSQELASLVPFRSQFGFDIMVWIGKQVFLAGKGEGVILEELRSRNIDISSSEIAYLAKKFVAYMAIAHRESDDKLRKFMGKSGGYILHLDGTCDGNSPNLMAGLDGISSIVLNSIKIRSEKSEYLIPFLEDIKKRYGIPVALVHDLGAGIKSAIKEVFPGVPDFICHYHFLRDIGEDLFEKEYRQLKTRLATLKVRNLLQVKARLLTETKKMSEAENIARDLMASLKAGSIDTKYLREFPWAVTFVLIRWALDTRFDLDGYGFPFDQHHYAFYLRLKTVRAVLEKIMNIHISSNWKDNRPINRIKLFLDEILADLDLTKAAKVISERISVFNRLREAMRIAEPKGQNGLNDDGDADIRSIEDRVKEFRKSIMENSWRNRQKIYQKMIKQIDANWEKLFTDPITVPTPQGDLVIQPQRTNNILERFFRDLRRTCRKRTGMISANKALKAMLGETPLVKNLENYQYMKILLAGAETLEERFAQIDAKLVRELMLTASKVKEKLTPSFKKVVFRENLPSEIAGIFLKWADKAGHPRQCAPRAPAGQQDRQAAAMTAGQAVSGF